MTIAFSQTRGSLEPIKHKLVNLIDKAEDGFHVWKEPDERTGEELVGEGGGSPLFTCIFDSFFHTTPVARWHQL